MKTPRSLLLFLVPALIFLLSFAVPIGTAIDYLGVPGPVRFDGGDYYLSWSSHPSGSYYKHEYVPRGESVERFNSMILIEAVLGDIEVKDAMNAQVGKIEARKKTDPVARYEVTENSSKNEYILDFVMSESQGDKVSVVEWNAYRYAKFRDASGHSGIMLFAISKRGYGDGTRDFFGQLKGSKQKWVNEIAAYNMPAINIKN